MSKKDHSQSHQHEHAPDIDKVSGVETTGHEWDGLKELNNPLPRWWLWVFLACCIWAAWFVFQRPMWPTHRGVENYTQFKELAESQAQIRARQNAYLERFSDASLDEIMADAELYNFALAGGNAVFKENCATCHGTGAEGNIGGYPNLNDDDWLWGGKLTDIYQTIHSGIRDTAHTMETRISAMPAFGVDNILPREDIQTLTDFVSKLHEGEDLTAHAGYKIFQENCATCHGADGKGGREVGAPNLADEIWLFGGSREQIFRSIYNPRMGMMPAWRYRLDENTLKQLAVYVHQLGGGEK